MKKIQLIAVVMLIGLSKLYGSDWHTEPDKWKKPRLFNRKFDKEFEKKILISRIKKGAEPDAKTYSRNQAYWFSVNQPDTTEPYPGTTKITVYNERDYVITIKLVDHAAQYETKVEWVNEKLLHVRFWWGRILGTYFIYDVEKEEYVIREMIEDGTITFQQWKEGSKK